MVGGNQYYAMSIKELQFASLTLCQDNSLHCRGLKAGAPPGHPPPRTAVRKRTDVRYEGCPGYAPTIPVLFQYKRSLREAAGWPQHSSD